MNKLSKFEISNPCSENWDAMATCESGRHCDKCEKVVVDFQPFKISRIHEYYNQHKEEDICGRFHKYQLEGHYNRYEEFFLSLYCSASRKIKKGLVRKTTLVLLTCCIALSGCNDKSGKPVKTFKEFYVMIKEKFSPETNQVVMGEMVCEDPKAKP